MSVPKTDTPDITPAIRFDLRSHPEELLMFVDEQAELNVWRELALGALERLHRLLNQHDQLRTALREVLAELETREKEHAA